MKKPVKTNIKFKDYSPGQTLLLPPSLEEMIDANHPVRIVNRVIDQVEMDPLIEKFKGGGTSSYHPRMLLKVIVFAYLSNIYSSRRMEAALKENIYFMWISGMSQPDHRDKSSPEFTQSNSQGLATKRRRDRAQKKTILRCRTCLW